MADDASHIPHTAEPEAVDNSMALEIVNDIKAELAGVARAMVNALKDGKISPAEGMAIGMKGMTLASNVLSLVQDATPDERDQVLNILEHGVMTLP